MRIVSITPSNTEIVWALGLEHMLVGVDDHSDFPPEVVERLPRVGTDLDVDVDAIAALQPDLVLASLSVPGMERNVEKLRQRNLPHVVLNPHSLSQVLDDILTVGTLTGHKERAERVVLELKERLDRLEGSIDDQVRSHPVRVFWEWWPRPLITPGRHSWINDICRLAGAVNVFADLDVTSRPVEYEEVFARDPDVICMCWVGALQPVMDPDKVRSREGWQNLRAVRDGRIYALPEELFGRPGPRLVEGAEMLAGLLHGGNRTAGVK